MTIDTLKKATALYIDTFKADVATAGTSLDEWYDIQIHVNEIISSLSTIVILEKYFEEKNDEKTERTDGKTD